MNSQLDPRVEVEVQQLMSNIQGGEPTLDRVREALKEPLLERWRLPAYQDFPCTSQGCTLLAWAIQMKNPEALDLLMANLRIELLPESPPVDYKSEEKADLLYTAVEYYHEPTWTFVIRRLDINRAFKHLGPNGNSALHAAAKRNKPGIFQALHKQAGKVLEDKLFLKDKRGQNALHVAASQRCHDTVLELLEIQPRLIAEQDGKGETVFHKAVVAHQKHTLQYLLALDASILTKCDKYGNSAYRTFVKDIDNRRHMQEESEKDMESFKHTPRRLTFDEEIGPILNKAILGLEHLTISERRHLLFKDEHGYELLWDLSTFDNENTNFSEYLLRLRQLNVIFHETLVRVALPNLSCTGKQSCDATTHGLRENPEANLIFKHLADCKVKHILKVVVPDCTIHSHSNRDIIDALKPFAIENLDWRKVDLGVTTIRMAAPEIETLKLYSSGNRDVLSNWIDTNGLAQFPKLHTIHITILRGEDTDLELQKIRLWCEEALSGLKSHEQNRTLSVVSLNNPSRVKRPSHDYQAPRFDKSAIIVTVEPEPVNNPKADIRLDLSQRRQGNILDKLAPLRDFLSRLDNLQRNERADTDYLKSKPVKVAILDSGVDADKAWFPTLTGASFIEDLTVDSHWHTITNPHGTIVASIVQNINPNCHVYAARTHHGFNMQGGDVDATIKALDWAMNQQVDIICISWTCAKDLDEESQERLERKIQEAGGKSLIFCATGDKGPSAKESYPAAFPSPFKICSCSVSGQPSANAEIDNTEFYIPAEELYVDLPQYLNQGKKGSADGSSAATAVAAGLAALILSLARFAFHSNRDASSLLLDDDTGSGDDTFDTTSLGGRDFHLQRSTTSRQIKELEEHVSRFKSRTVMRKIFKYMCHGSDKFVQPWEVFPMELAFEDFDTAKTSVADFLSFAKSSSR